VGGGARSQYWGKILSSVFDQPLIYRRGGEVGPAYGAARLARLALTGEEIEEVCAPPPIETIIEPSEKLSEHLAARRPLFQSLYKSLEPLFTENA
ncbi:MAG: xylulokinase, partial [Oricola sp.]|nr:xylulokinase [Oricola sp.]